MVFIIAFSTLLTFVYLLLIVVLLKALKRYREQKNTLIKDLPGVSLIVPFRDEAAKLPGLFKCLASLDYPQEKLEILLIDDHSRDESLSLVKQFCKSTTWHVKTITSASGAGKKAALKSGINAAKHNLVAQTDADCILGSSWLRDMVLHMSTDTMVVSGPVAMKPQSGVWSTFAALEFMSLQAVSASFVKLNRPIMASGANLLYRKSIWDDNWVRSDKMSGDDTFLIQHAKKKGKVEFAMQESAQVITEAAGSLAELINQRARWGGKSFSYPSRIARFLSLFIAAYNLLLVALALASFFEIQALPILVGSLIVKAIVDWPFLKFYANATGQSALMKYFLFSILLYPFYVVMTGAIIIFGTTEWKSRTFKPITE